EFTWSNNETATRIDQIWLTEGLLKKVTCAEIQELLVIMSSDHELPVACLRLKGIPFRKGSDQKYQTVLWKKLDGKIPKVFRNVTFDPNKEDLIRLNEVLDQTWENIETAIMAATKKTVLCFQ
ncbi:34741_t:CDS:2, partial [Gigaspora margarita]